MKIYKKDSMIIYYLIAIFIIYASDSMLFSANSQNSINNLSKIVQLLVGSLSFVGYILFKKISHKELFLLLFIAISLTFTHLVNEESTIIALQRYSVILFSYVIIKSADLNKLIIAYLRIMLVIAIVSIIGYIFVHEILASGVLPTIVNGKGKVFAFGVLTNLPISTVRTRNWGPFVEPGVYQGYLVISIIFVLYTVKVKRKILYLIIYSIALFTTYSTTGYIAIALAILSYLLLRDNHVSKKIKLGVFVVGVIMVFILSTNGVFYRLFTNKFVHDNVPERLLSIKYGLLTFFYSPLFGHGSNYLQASNQLAGMSFNFTNSIIGNYVIFGLVIGTMYLIGFIKFSLILTKKLIPFIFLTLSIIAVLSGQLYPYSYIFHIIMLFGLIGNPKRLESNS